VTAATQVRLANDIAAQFAYLDHDKAVAGIVTHLTAFWDPRMRAQLLAHLAAGGEGLDPLARDAASRL
jgi:formate dehydrogenase subunit delta